MQTQSISLQHSSHQATPHNFQQHQSQNQLQKLKTHDQNQVQNNNSGVLSASQACSSGEKQEKQSSNDGLNSQRSYPSSLHNQKDRPRQIQSKNKSGTNQNQNNGFHQNCGTDNSQALSDQQQDSKLHQNIFQDPNRKVKLTLMKLIFIICKKQYAFEIIRIMMYALISISVFAYVLDQNKQKKQFYEAFYSSQQITISKEINGVFPPLFGSQIDIINRTWVLQTYNSQLKVEHDENWQPTREELYFQFTPYNVLYIKTNNETCAEQLKFRWKIFDYNMRIYQVIESDFEKIEDEKLECFPKKRQMEQKMREVSLWTIDWQSRQLYLLSEPFRDDAKEGKGGSGRERWNELIVLKRQSASV